MIYKTACKWCLDWWPKITIEWKQGRKKMENWKTRKISTTCCTQGSKMVKIYWLQISNLENGQNMAYTLFGTFSSSFSRIFSWNIYINYGLLFSVYLILEGWWLLIGRKFFRDKNTVKKFVFVMLAELSLKFNSRESRKDVWKCSQVMYIRVKILWNPAQRVWNV